MQSRSFGVVASITIGSISYTVIIIGCHQTIHIPIMEIFPIEQCSKPSVVPKHTGW